MRLRSCLLIVFLLVSHALHAQPAYGLQYPFSQSPGAGASFHLLLHREISALRNLLVPSTIFPGNPFAVKAGNMAYRLLLLGTLDFYLTYLPVVNQHEYFGHLGRAKQFKAGYTRYEIYWFPPTGGRAYFGNHQFHQLSDAERMVEMAGGIEANNVLADEICRNVIRGGGINFNTSMLLLGARSDLVTYLLFEEESSFNDIDQYLQVFNQSRARDAHIEKHDLLLPVTLTFLSSPFVMQATYNLVRDFLLRGKEESAFVLFNNHARVKFLPVPGFALTPYGPVISLGSYIEAGNLKCKVSLGHGFPRTVRHNEISFAAYHIPLFSSAFSADLELKGWKGKGFQMHDRAGNIISSGDVGGLAALDIYYRLPVGPFKGRIPFLMGGCYVKTNGYTRGYRLNNGAGFRVAAGYFFGSP